MLLMTGGSVTLAHTHQAATTPSPSMISQDPFHVPTLRTQTRPTSSSTPCLPALTFCVLPRLIAISCSPWAKPQSLLHASLCLAPLPTLQKWDAHTLGARQGWCGRDVLGQPVLPRYGGFRCCKAAGPPHPLQTPFPTLAEAQLEAVGPVMGRALGKGVLGLRQGCPKLPLIQGTVPVPSCNSTPCLPHGWKPNPAQIGASLAAGLAVR